MRNAIILILIAAALLLAGVFLLLRPGARAPDTEEIARRQLPQLPQKINRDSDLFEALVAAYSDALDASALRREDFALAYLYHANGYLQEATAAYEALRESAGSDQRAGYLESMALLDLGEQQAAIDRLEALAESDDVYPLVHLRLGDVLLKTSAVTEAKTAYTEGLAEGTYDYHALLGLAQVALLEQHWEAALDALRKAIQIDDTMVTPFTLMAQAFTGLGEEAKKQNALKDSVWKTEYNGPKDPWYESMLATYCFDPYQLLVFAEIAQQSGNQASAKALIDRAAEIAPHDSNVLVELGGRALSANDVEQAQQRFAQAIKEDPSNERAYAEYARACLVDEDTKAAFSILQQGLDRNPKSAALHNFLGQLYLGKSALSEARQHLEEAHAIDPMGLPQMKNLGLLLLALGEPKGVPLINDYLTYQADDQGTASILARHWLAEGRIENALAVLEKAIEAIPNPDDELRQIYAGALHRQANTLAQRGDFEEAISALEKSLNLWPDNPEALANFGMLHTQLGHHERGIAALFRFAELQPDNPLAWLNLGKAHLMADDAKTAVEFWQRGLQIARRDRHPAARELARLIDQFEQ